MATAPPTPRDQPVKRFVILLIGALFVLGVAYYSGVRASGPRLKAARAAQKEAESQLSAARVQLDERAATLRQLEARRQLHLALLALDERNFGIAQNHLSSAAIRLRNVQGSANSADLNALTEQIKALNIVAAGDMDAQRDQVLDLARRLDSLISLDSLPGHGMSPEQMPTQDAP